MTGVSLELTCLVLLLYFLSRMTIAIPLITLLLILAAAPRWTLRHYPEHGSNQLVFSGSG